MAERTPMTREGFQKLEEELKSLKTTARPEIVREIEAARAHGDLSENAEYHAAKERQGHIEGRIRVIEDKLARAQVIDPTGQDGSSVRFGATVVLEDADSGEQLTYTILGEEETDVAEGRISIQSPVARALLGREVGDTVNVRVPKGTRELEILKIHFD